MPGALESGQFALQEQDFFKELARKGDEYVYMFRHVLCVASHLTTRSLLTGFAGTTGRLTMEYVIRLELLLHVSYTLFQVAILKRVAEAAGRKVITPVSVSLVIL